MKKEKLTEDQQGTSDVADRLIEPLKNVVTVGQIIAVFADDTDFNFYLLFLKENLYIFRRRYN